MTTPYAVHILETPQEMAAVEALQRLVWPGSEVEIVPVHLLVTAVHNGGLVIGVFDTNANPESPPLVGFVFGFPGLVETPAGLRPKHCSHMMGVNPTYRDQGLGFVLKRAQWQMVRHQGLERITWTYDPLLSRNAHLNIARLGAVCNTYRRDIYGSLRDGLNAGLPSDRFQVDWWVNTARVNRRLSRNARLQLDLAHYYASGAQVINPTQVDSLGWPHPAPLAEATAALDLHYREQTGAHPGDEQDTIVKPDMLLLAEIPENFPALKAADPVLALEWRLHSRLLFENLFTAGYLATDFIHLPGTYSRSFYVFSYGESTL